jgi:type IV pilus assembly protein PilQ
MTSIQERTIMTHWRSRALALALGLGASLSALAQNAIQSISSTQQAGADVVRIELAQPLASVPAGFAIQTPPRIAIDLPGVGNALGRSTVEMNQGNLRRTTARSSTAGCCCWCSRARRRRRPPPRQRPRPRRPSSRRA